MPDPFRAARIGDLTTLERLFSQGLDLDKRSLFRRRTLLTEAIKRDQYHVMRWLLANKVDSTRTAGYQCKTPRQFLHELDVRDMTVLFNEYHCD